MKIKLKSKPKMKKFCLFCLVVALAGFVSCQKQQTEEERKAEIDRQVEQRLAAERQAQEKDQLAQRAADLDAREKALANQQNAPATTTATETEAETPSARSTSSPRAARESSDEGGDYNIFYTKLDSYGDWRETSDYGYVWQPREAQRSRNWHPYTEGRWVYTDAGWTWVSEEPFGWATYHYGRWTRLRGVGWVWVPGNEWAPAWVSWRKSDEYVGWAPLPPEARFDRRRGIHNWADNYYDIGPDQYRFVATREFGNKEIQRNVVPRERNVTIINQTTNVTNITYSNTTVINQGPNYDELRTRSQQPIERLRLERDANINLNVEVGRAVVRGEVIAVPAPVIAIGRPAERPRTVKAAIAQTVVEHGWEDIGDKQAAEQARTKMKSESTPPPDGPSKTFVKPEIAAASSPSAVSAAPAQSAAPSASAMPTATPSPSLTPARSRPMQKPLASVTPSAAQTAASATPTSTPERSEPPRLTETAAPSASPTATSKPGVRSFPTSTPSPTVSLTPKASSTTSPRRMTPASTPSASATPSSSPKTSSSTTATASPSIPPNDGEEYPKLNPKTFAPKKSLARQIEPIRIVPMSPTASPAATVSPSASPNESKPVTSPAASRKQEEKGKGQDKEKEKGKEKHEPSSKPSASGSPTPTPTPPASQ